MLVSHARSANPASTDIEIAYQRMLGQDSVLVPQWFDDFCEVMLQQDLQHLKQRLPGSGAEADLPGIKEGGEGSEEDEEEEEETKGLKARRAVKGTGPATQRGKKRGSAAGRASTGQKRGGRGRGRDEEGAGAAAGEDGSGREGLEGRALEWAARFSHAVAELEHLGVLRPSKRRKEQAVQRTFHPPGSLAVYGLGV
jgi:hypothetical protein